MLKLLPLPPLTMHQQQKGASEQRTPVTPWHSPFGPSLSRTHFLLLLVDNVVDVDVLPSFSAQESSIHIWHSDLCRDREKEQTKNERQKDGTEEERKIDTDAIGLRHPSSLSDRERNRRTIEYIFWHRTKRWWWLSPSIPFFLVPIPLSSFLLIVKEGIMRATNTGPIRDIH